MAAWLALAGLLVAGCGLTEGTGPEIHNSGNNNIFNITDGDGDASTAAPATVGASSTSSTVATQP